MPAQVAPQRRWTLDEFYQERNAAPAGERWELVDGEVLVTPSPNWTHQGVVGRLFEHLAAYARSQNVGRAFAAPLDVTLEPKLVLQPDVLVVPVDLLKRREDRVNRLLLAAEVLSPSSARHDRVRKRPVYQRNLVPQYWIIDPESEIVELWTPDDDRPEIVSEALTWHPVGAAQPLGLDLRAFFAEVRPEG